MSNILSGASTATHLLIKIDRRIILVAGLVTPFLSVKRNALGTLKIQRRDGSESVASEVNLPSSSLYRDYSYLLTLSDIGEPSRS